MLYLYVIEVIPGDFLNEEEVQLEKFCDFDQLVVKFNANQSMHLEY